MDRRGFDERPQNRWACFFSSDSRRGFGVAIARSISAFRRLDVGGRGRGRLLLGGLERLENLDRLDSRTPVDRPCGAPGKSG